MISAKEARKLTNTSTSEQLEKELKSIEEVIVYKAKCGYDYAIYDDIISKQALLILASEGYRTEEYPTIRDCAYTLCYKISW